MRSTDAVCKSFKVFQIRYQISDRAYLVPTGNEATVSLIWYSTNAAQLKVHKPRSKYTFGDCVIESEHGSYECVMFLLYLNNKDEHVRYN